MFKEELESNFSTRICRRLERLQSSSMEGQEEWLGEARRVAGDRARLQARREELKEQKNMWEKYHNLGEQKPKSLDSLLRGKKLKGLVNALNARVRQ